MVPVLVMHTPVYGQMMFDAYMALYPVINEDKDQIELICCTITWN